MIRATDRSRPTGLKPAIAAVIAAAAFAPAAGLSEQPIERSLYVTDSSTDRTPAKTSFPAYPRIARRDRIEGDATVCFKITSDGRIRSVRIKHYSHRIFRRPALRAIKASSFEPLRPDEILSGTRTCRTYRFRLEPIVAENPPDDDSKRR
jgi:TonB family protein